MSTVRIVPLAAPVAAGVATTANGAIILLSVVVVLATLLTARTLLHRIHKDDPTRRPPA